jgi:hypothetical protein
MILKAFKFRLNFSFLLPIFLLAPTTTVIWRADGQGLKVMLELSDAHIQECLNGGLEVRHRLELRLCRRRASWWDDCEDAQSIIRSVTYNPISESYNITSDQMNDEVAPVTSIATDADQATKLTQEFSFNTPKGFVRDRQESHYVSVRARAVCQQDAKSLVAQIPYYLTFGIFRFAGVDSGWIDYDLSE